MNIDTCETILCDLDGVLVPTAKIHMVAWQEMFDDVSASHNWNLGYTDGDYYTYVDGRSRVDGVRAVLASRGLVLPEGTHGDDPAEETVNGLANRKNERFLALLDTSELSAYPNTHQVLSHFAGEGKRLAVVSSSRNAVDVLTRTGLSPLIELVVDGRAAAELGLPGKPDPATFLYAARALQTSPGRCAVLEDALAGVAAGRAGGFGLVVGVDRGVGAAALLEAGADMVVTTLDELVGT